MATEPLTFALLEAQCSLYIQDDKDHSHPKGRWVAVLGILIAAIGVMLAKAFPSWFFIGVAFVGAAMEIVGCVVVLFYGVRDEWRSYHEQRETTAKRMDRDYAQFRRVVDWLSVFPLSQREQHLRYIQDRKTTFAYRFGLMAGSVERFGVFPILVVLYLQFKDWQFGDWHALTQIHAVGTFILALMVGMYFGGFLAIRDKNRADLYESVLAESCAGQ